MSEEDNTIFEKNENYILYNGNMLEILNTLQENSIESIITDPPYELNFMGKSWDKAGVSFNKETWEKCLRILKPGGYLLAFGGSRTYHRIACAIEDAGFEIRDTIMWLYGSGFPKSMNIGLAIDKKNEEATNEWQGWGTCLKPSFEPIIVARKPFKGSLVDNVIEYGVGGLNIDECRVFGNDTEELQKNWNNRKAPAGFGNGMFGGPVVAKENIKDYTPTGRFPANTILTYDDTDYEEVCDGFPYTKNSKRSSEYNKDTEYTNTYTPTKAIYTDNNTYGDEGSASRYFYCAKASKRDRDEGLEDFIEHTPGERTNRKEGSAGITAYAGATGKAKNIHPTVKPTELMQYLVRLVSPKGATILDPFNGSGSTGKAVMYENKDRNANYKYIGIDLSEEYLKISKARIDYVINQLEE